MTHFWPSCFHATNRQQKHCNRPAITHFDVLVRANGRLSDLIAHTRFFPCFLRRRICRRKMILDQAFGNDPAFVAARRGQQHLKLLRVPAIRNRARLRKRCGGRSRHSLLLPLKWADAPSHFPLITIVRILDDYAQQTGELHGLLWGNDCALEFLDADLHSTDD